MSDSVFNIFMVFVSWITCVILVANGAYYTAVNFAFLCILYMLILVTDELKSYIDKKLDKLNNDV